MDDEPDDIMLYEHDATAIEPDPELYGGEHDAHAMEASTPNNGIIHQPIAIDHPAFSDLRGASISASTAHAYIKVYNALIERNAWLDIQNAASLDKQLMTYIQGRHRDSARPAALNNVLNCIYCLLLIHPYLNAHIAGSKRLMTKWKNSSAQKSAIPLLQPFEHAFHLVQHPKRKAVHIRHNTVSTSGLPEIHRTQTTIQGRCDPPRQCTAGTLAIARHCLRSP